MASVNRREIFGWAMFDFANSAFTTVMITAFFPLFFTGTVVGPAAPGGGMLTDGKVLLGLCETISQGFVILTAPLLGALADFSGAKKKFLAATYLGCSILTMSLGFVGPGDVGAAMTLFILANICFSSGENFIAAFLPEVAPTELIGRISGMAWGLGYIGGIGSLLAAVAILRATNDDGYHWVWVMTGAWFLIAGSPTFFLVKERHKHGAMLAGASMWTIGFARLGRTLREVSRFRQLFRFLAILAFYSCGTSAVTLFATTIARDLLKFDTTQMGMFLIVLNVTAAVGALASGWVQDRFGSRRTIITALAGWAAAAVIAMFVKTSPTGEPTASGVVLFWIAGNVVGLSMGATFSAGRALVGLFSPEDRAAEFFGLWGLFGKLGAVGGPLFYGAMGHFFGTRVAVASLGIFFLGGLLLMFTVDEAEGRRAAGRAKVSTAKRAYTLLN